MNAFGEEVIVENADKSNRNSIRKNQCVVSDYTAAPVFFSEQENGAHEWLIEFDKLPADINEFTFALDDALKSVNSDYEAKRYQNIALRMPIVHILRTGTFREWLKKKR